MFGDFMGRGMISCSRRRKREVGGGGWRLGFLDLYISNSAALTIVLAFLLVNQFLLFDTGNTDLCRRMGMVVYSVPFY